MVSFVSFDVAYKLSRAFCQEWVTTAEATLRVEFPSWSFLGAFEIFHPCAGKDGKQLEENLGKLAQVFEVDRDELKRQYVGMLPLVQSLKAQSGQKSNRCLWADALLRAKDRRLRSKYPQDALFKAWLRSKKA